MEPSVTLANGTIVTDTREIAKLYRLLINSRTRRTHSVAIVHSGQHRTVFDCVCGSRHTAATWYRDAKHVCDFYRDHSAHMAQQVQAAIDDLALTLKSTPSTMQTKHYEIFPIGDDQPVAYVHGDMSLGRVITYVEESAFDTDCEVIAVDFDGTRTLVATVRK